MKHFIPSLIRIFVLCLSITRAFAEPAPSETGKSPADMLWKDAIFALEKTLARLAEFFPANAITVREHASSARARLEAGDCQNAPALILCLTLPYLALPCALGSIASFGMMKQCERTYTLTVGAWDNPWNGV